MRRRPVWVMAGDSHTFGQSGFPLCDAVAGRFPDVTVVNAGVNADLAWNLAERMDAVLAPAPDLVHVCIGTNDVNAGLHPDHAAGYLRDKGLPHPPTPEFYRMHLRRIFGRVREAGARLVVSAIPPIGDEADSAWNRAVRQYNGWLETEATAYGVRVFPLYDRLMAVVDRSRVVRIDRTDWGHWIPDSQRLHDADGLDWDAIADRRGLQLTHDGLHLNDRAGRVWLEGLVQELDAAR